MYLTNLANDERLNKGLSISTISPYDKVKDLEVNLEEYKDKFVYKVKASAYIEYELILKYCYSIEKEVNYLDDIFFDIPSAGKARKHYKMKMYRDIYKYNSLQPIVKLYGSPFLEEEYNDIFREEEIEEEALEGTEEAEEALEEVEKIEIKHNYVTLEQFLKLKMLREIPNINSVLFYKSNKPLLYVVLDKELSSEDSIKLNTSITLERITNVNILEQELVNQREVHTEYNKEHYTLTPEERVMLNLYKTKSKNKLKSN